MLYLTRKTGQTVIINDNIEVTVVEVRGRAVKLGFTFPPEATVLRKEIHEKILRENLEASRAREVLVEVEIDAEALTSRLAQKAKT